MSATTKVNPEQIVFLTYQLRQLEIYRNDSKKPHEKESMTMQIRRLKEQLDPLLMAFAEERKKTEMVVDRDVSDEDLGPAEVVEAMHIYAKMKALQTEVLEHLQKEPVSVAGEYNGVMYVMHFEKATKPF